MCMNIYLYMYIIACTRALKAGPHLKTHWKLYQYKRDTIVNVRGGGMASPHTLYYVNYPLLDLLSHDFLLCVGLLDWTGRLMVVLQPTLRMTPIAPPSSAPDFRRTHEPPTTLWLKIAVSTHQANQSNQSTTPINLSIAFIDRIYQPMTQPINHSCRTYIEIAPLSLPHPSQTVRPPNSPNRHLKSKTEPLEFLPGWTTMVHEVPERHPSRSCRQL